MLARHLYGDLHATIAEETKISAACLTTFDYWAGRAMQKAIPKWFNGTGGKEIPGARYKHLAKGRFTAMPSFEDFGSDTDPSSVYKKILNALESAENLLQNHINNTMGSASFELKRVCRHMLQRSKKFVEGLFRYMDSTYRELNVSFGDKNETWELGF